MTRGISGITSAMVNIVSEGVKKSKNIGKYLLSSENRNVLKGKRGSYDVTPISKRKIAKASSEPIPISITGKENSSEKPKTLDNIYVEKGLKGVTDKLVNELKQLTPLSNVSVNSNNKQDTLENQSIKKHLNSKLEKEINKEIDSLIEQTQLEGLSTNATSDSSFERHELFKPLIKLRDGLQEDHNLDVFTDQLSNQANKSLLGMDYNTRAKVVEEAVGSENIDIDALSRATENNYNRNYGHFPDTLPTNSADELANAIIDLNLSEIGEDVLNKKSKPNKKKLPQHKAAIQNKKERNILKIEIEKLISSGKLDTTKLETKYQKLKTENHEKTVAASKTELQTQDYIGNITLQAVRENLGEEQSKTDIDDRWSAIKTEFDDQLGQAIDEAIKIIHTYQKKTTPSNENTKQEDSMLTTDEINNSLKFDQSSPASSLDSKDNESFV